MDKIAAVAQYLAMKPSPKYFKRNVMEEVCDAISAWKEDCFAPSLSDLDGLTDEKFAEVYDLEYKDTFEHELAEAIEHVYKFAKAHDIDIFKYLTYLEKYRKIEGKNYIPIVPELSSTTVIMH